MAVATGIGRSFLERNTANKSTSTSNESSVRGVERDRDQPATTTPLSGLSSVSQVNSTTTTETRGTGRSALGVRSSRTTTNNNLGSASQLNSLNTPPPASTQSNEMRWLGLTKSDWEGLQAMREAGDIDERENIQSAQVQRAVDLHVLGPGYHWDTGIDNDNFGSPESEVNARDGAMWLARDMYLAQQAKNNGNGNSNSEDNDNSFNPLDPAGIVPEIGGVNPLDPLGLIPEIDPDTFNPTDPLGIIPDVSIGGFNPLNPLDPLGLLDGIFGTKRPNNRKAFEELADNTFTFQELQRRHGDLERKTNYQESDAAVQEAYDRLGPESSEAVRAFGRLYRGLVKGENVTANSEPGIDDSVSSIMAKLLAKGDYTPAQVRQILAQGLYQISQVLDKS